MNEWKNFISRRRNTHDFDERWIKMEIGYDIKLGEVSAIQTGNDFNGKLKASISISFESHHWKSSNWFKVQKNSRRIIPFSFLPIFWTEWNLKINNMWISRSSTCHNKNRDYEFTNLLRLAYTYPNRPTAANIVDGLIDVLCSTETNSSFILIPLFLRLEDDKWTFELFISIIWETASQSRISQESRFSLYRSVHVRVRWCNREKYKKNKSENEKRKIKIKFK